MSDRPLIRPRGRPGDQGNGEPKDHRPTHPPPSFIAAATLGVVGVPALAMLTLLFALRPEADMALIVALSLGVALAASVVGQAVWTRRPESRRFALADLMVWNAIRRKNAERRVERKAHLLGFDLEGRFAGHARVPREQQLAIAREISRALEIKSTYSRNHSRRVERHARRLAAALGLSDEETEQLALAATLHDIGNIKIPDELLRKPETLTAEERETVEGHVLLGAAMAFTAGSTDVVNGVRHHHEHWDGSGYPSGLEGDDIPLFPRIIAIAAAYEAMTSPRTYRRAFARDHALEILRSQAGRQFDPHLVDLFISTLSEQRAASLFPVLGLPIQRARRTLTSLRGIAGGTAAALVAGTTAIVLLGTAIVAPGTFRFPTPFISPTALPFGNGSVVVELEAPEDDTEEPTESGDEADDADQVTTVAGVGVGDVVLGTRIEQLPPEGVVGTPPDGDPSPEPPTGPGPGPEPEPTPPDGPAVGPEVPDPGVTLPDKDKNKKRKGRGHAYGHDPGPDHPGQVHGNGHDKDKGKDKDKDGKPGHVPGPPDVPLGAPDLPDDVPGNANGHDKGHGNAGNEGPDVDAGGLPDDGLLDSLLGSVGVGPE